ncbi:26S proteasome non-ATPase regulatory subunit 7-like [Camellia sinensis]|uniref:26S proteasome non-ATPase regulatory subunit 7-like n=1 Tax=Camellia sinensis TaxID=4442 RepID=UPI0010366075|nr:26S proteasome non-ATPase regulatory subunit 7-like [Camellia sinensis]
MYNIYVPNPVLVIIDVEPKEMGIPTKAYYAVEEVKENATQKSQKVFVHVPSEIAAHDVHKLLFCCLILLLSSVLFLTVTMRLPIFKKIKGVYLKEFSAGEGVNGVNLLLVLDKILVRLVDKILF